MIPVSHPLQFLLVALAGWINQQQREVIEYLQAENRVLREQLGSRRLRFTDDQRIRLAAKAKRVGRRVLLQFPTIVTPDTLLAWHRHLIARKYDATENRDWGYTRMQGALANLGHTVGEARSRPSCGNTGLSPRPNDAKVQPGASSCGRTGTCSPPRTSLPWRCGRRPG